MELTVEDIMQTAVKVVGPEEKLSDLDRAFLEAGVGGFPVIDKEGHLIGIVSRSDIVRQLNVEQSIAEAVSDFYRDLSTYNSDTAESLNDIANRVGQRLEHMHVKDVMIRNVIAVTRQNTVADLAKLMIDHGVHRLPVTDGNQLAGIVTALDLVRLIAEEQILPA